MSTHYRLYILVGKAIVVYNIAVLQVGRPVTVDIKAQTISSALSRVAAPGTSCCRALTLFVVVREESSTQVSSSYSFTTV